MNLLQRSTLGALAKLNKPTRSSRASAATPQHTSTRHGAAQGERSFPTEADVVVVGGGSVGCSTAYHLAKLGAGRVVLLERHKLTAGTTWHTSGLLWRVASRELEMMMVSHTYDLMTSGLREEVDVDTGWVRTGGLFTASTQQRMEAHKRSISISKVFGVDAQLLSPGDIAQVHPLLDVSHFVGALYSPLDGTMDPTGTCTAYSKGALKYGAQIIEDCAVDGIDTGVDDFGLRRVCSVRTNRGTIKTNHVINCAGVWAPKIGQMVGVETPQVAFRQAYAVTQPIEGVRALPNVRHMDAAMYLKRQGDTLQVGGYEKNPILCDKVDDDFAFGLYDLDWDVYAPLLKIGCDIMPAIAESGIRTTICGPESFTPDGSPLCGESPEVRGFFYGSGFNGGGMMLGGGAGEQIALWAMRGKSELDMFSWDIRRFPSSAATNKQWVMERSHESYISHYNIVYPNDQPLAGRNLNTDPLHQVLLDRGCFYEVQHTSERPAYFHNGAGAGVKRYDFHGAYGHSINRELDEYAEKLRHDQTFEHPGPAHEAIRSECVAARTSCVVLNTSSIAKLVLEGPDASEAAKVLFSRDVSSGDSSCTLMLNHKGGIEADAVVYRMTDEGAKYIVTVLGPPAEYCVAHIDDVLSGRGLRCSVRDCSGETVSLSLQGPKSYNVLKQLVEEECIKDLASGKMLTCKLAGIKVLLTRSPLFGEAGYEIWCDNAHALNLYKTIMEVVEQHGGRDAGFRAMEALRLEAGIHHWGKTLRTDDSPLEARLMHLCDVDRLYHGAEAVDEMRRTRPKKSLLYFTVDDSTQLHGGETIWRNGKVVGETRIGAHAFNFNKSVVMGYVKLDDMEGGTVDEYLLKGCYEIERCCVKRKADAHLTSPFDLRCRS